MSHHEDGADSGIDYAAQTRAHNEARLARIMAVESSIRNLWEGELSDEDFKRISFALQAKVSSDDDYDGIA